MSTKTQQNVMATALVALMLVLGGLFGYALLGGHDSDSAGATTPADMSACVLCATEPQQGGGGNTPSLLTARNSGGGGNH
jgi:hypothetical protein